MMHQLTPTIILGIIVIYFLILMAVSYYTGKDASNANFFLAGRKSPWYLVAFGMIGASLSGVTFISVPGAVGALPEIINAETGEVTVSKNVSFSYMQVVLGYLLGYLFIAQVLLPLYYRLNLTSIYGYLEQRFGVFSYKTGAAYFLLSRIVGASFRLFLVAIVLDEFVLGVEPINFPFWATVVCTILLIWIYTFRGGINTIIYTDALQTLCMLVAVILAIIGIASALETDLGGVVELISTSEYSQVFFFDKGWSDPNNFYKQFFSGALITIVMTGLDQDMMQKNLSCRNVQEAQLNMYTFSIILVFVNLLFLSLGALLYIYASNVGIELAGSTDKAFPTIALKSLSPAVGIVFILGLIAAAYSSADSALTSLTTSFCIDFLNFEKSDESDSAKQGKRFIVHIAFSIIILITIIIFKSINDDAVINNLFVAAGYTYGPILGLFAFGMLTRLKVRDEWVIPVCILAPILSYLLNRYSSEILAGFEFGFLIIALNGLLTFLGLLAISYRDYEAEHIESQDEPVTK